MKVITPTGQPVEIPPEAVVGFTPERVIGPNGQPLDGCWMVVKLGFYPGATAAVLHAQLAEALNPPLVVVPSPGLRLPPPPGEGGES